MDINIIAMGQRIRSSRIEKKISSEVLAEKIGIARNRSVTYENDPEGVAINFKAVGRAVSKAVQAESMEEVFDGNWSEEIVEHKKNSRGRKRG